MCDAELKLAKKANASLPKPLSESAVTLIIESIMSLTPPKNKALRLWKLEENHPAVWYAQRAPTLHSQRADRSEQRSPKNE